MKTTMISFLFLSICFTQCKKVETKVENTTNKVFENDFEYNKSFTYKALDGTRAKVTYTNSEKEHTVIVESNGNKIQLDLKDKNKNMALYERAGIKATAKGDSLIIKQGENTIPMVKQ